MKSQKKKKNLKNQMTEYEAIEKHYNNTLNESNNSKTTIKGEKSNQYSHQNSNFTINTTGNIYNDDTMYGTENNYHNYNSQLENQKNSANFQNLSTKSNSLVTNKFTINQCATIRKSSQVFDNNECISNFENSKSLPKSNSGFHISDYKDFFSQKNILDEEKKTLNNESIEKHKNPLVINDQENSNTLNQSSLKNNINTLPNNIQSNFFNDCNTNNNKNNNNLNYSFNSKNLSSEKQCSENLVDQGSKEIKGNSNNEISKNNIRNDNKEEKLKKGGSKKSQALGLKEISNKVKKIMKNSAVTTYRNISDSIIKEENIKDTQESKNIRRRIYDSLNVLKALDLFKSSTNNPKAYEWSTTENLDEILLEKQKEVEIQQTINYSKKNKKDEILFKIKTIKNIINRNKLSKDNQDDNKETNEKRFFPPFLVINSIKTNSNVACIYDNDLKRLHVSDQMPIMLHGDHDVFKKFFIKSLLANEEKTNDLNHENKFYDISEKNNDNDNKVLSKIPISKERLKEDSYSSNFSGKEIQNETMKGLLLNQIDISNEIKKSNNNSTSFRKYHYLKNKRKEIKEINDH